MGKLERQKLDERLQFTFDEKEAIAEKSDHLCCHCGKKVFFGTGKASIEHFIPLSKGGLNRDLNLVLLCHDCNAAKGNLILNPDDYLIYLKDDYREKLHGYFESYIQSFEYVSRGNLLSCDQYKIYIEPTPARNRYKRNFSGKKVNNYVILKRATVDDIPKIIDYFERYCKKYNCYRDHELCDLNIRFWYQFGCIYYVEGVDGIKLLATITVADTDGEFVGGSIDHTLSMSLFAYYDTQQALTIINGVLFKIPQLLIKEQGLKQIPFKINVVASDPSAVMVLASYGGIDHNDGDVMVHRFMVMHGEDRENLPKIDEDSVLTEFFNKFANVKEDVERWIDADEDLAWMKDEIVEHVVFSDS